MCLKKIDQRLFGIIRHRRREFSFSETTNSKNVEDEDAVVGGNGPSALRDDVRMSHIAFVADALDVINDVASILLKRVIHARLEICLRAVVVDAQAAPYIEVAQSSPQ